MIVNPLRPVNVMKGAARGVLRMRGDAGFPA